MHSEQDAKRRAEYGRLVEAEYRAVYRFLYWRHADRSVAEDLTQETFLRAWNGLDARRGGPETEGAWLFAIARRVSLDHHRKPRLPSVSLQDSGDRTDGAPLLPDQLAADAESAALLRAVLSLPEPYRSAVALTKIEELSTAEAARLLGVPQGTLKWRVARALGMLRQRLAATDGADALVGRRPEEVLECGG